MPVQLSSNARAKLDDLQTTYPRDGIPGTVFGIINKEGEILYEAATGARNVQDGTAMTKDTMFPIFSCTKVVCGIACLQAVEQGYLTLDESLGRFAKELGEPELVYESSPTEIRTKKASRPITLRMLLTHTAGYTYSWYNQHIRHWVDQNHQEFTGKHLGMPIVNEPGTKFEYGINMDWAGIVLEKATGMSLGEWCEKNIFSPLGLKDSVYDMRDRPDLLQRLVTMHTWHPITGQAKPRDHVRMVSTPPFHSGGGGLMSTAKDFLRIMTVLLNDGVGYNGIRILKAETLRSAFVDQMELMGIADLGGLGTNAEVGSTDTSTASGALVMLPGLKKGWGLTFLMNLEDIPGGRKAKSAEWGGVANLWWMADPTTEVAMVIFNSVLPYGLPAFEKLEHQFQDIIYSPGALIRA